MSKKSVSSSGKRTLAYKAWLEQLNFLWEYRMLEEFALSFLFVWNQMPAEIYEQESRLEIF